MRKMEFLPTHDCEASYGPVYTLFKFAINVPIIRLVSKKNV